MQFMLAEATVARERDLGFSDLQYTVRTHLGHILQPGDLVYG
jgi:nonsense-mediated mRNA decay protein 3